MIGLLACNMVILAGIFIAMAGIAFGIRKLIFRIELLEIALGKLDAPDPEPEREPAPGPVADHKETLEELMRRRLREGPLGVRPPGASNFDPMDEGIYKGY